MSRNDLGSFALILADEKIIVEAAGAGSKLSVCDTLADIIRQINAETLHGKPKVRQPYIHVMNI